MPIARDGAEVVGIDHSAPMLAHLRTVLAREAPVVRRRVRLRRGDIRKHDLGRRFPLVIAPFNVVLHLYTRPDVEAWLATVRRHLAPGGELVFDVSMPILEDLARDPRVPFRVPPFDHPTAGRVRYREHFDYDRVRQILFVSMFFEPTAARERAKATSDVRGSVPASPAESFMTPLAHRQFFPQEMEALLHYNGFEATALHGDFAGGPLHARSDVMVWHARATRRRP